MAAPQHAERDVQPGRALHVCMPVYARYELDNRVRRYAEALAGRGHRVEVLALRMSGEPRFEIINGVRISRIQTRTYGDRSPLNYLLRLVAFLLRSFLRISLVHLRQPFDLVHVHSVPDFEVFAALVPKLAGSKLILDIHDIVPEFYAEKFNVGRTNLLFRALLLVEKCSCRFVDHVIVSNHLWQRTLVARSVPEPKCTVIMNYPDEALFRERARTRTDGRFVLLYPGGLARHQGVDLAIEAFALIKDQVPEAVFLIYGHGPERTALKKLVRDKGLGQRVQIRDPVSIEEIPPLMTEADLGIVPKRNTPFGGEAFSTKVLEFMASGTPLIVARTAIDDFYFNENLLRFFRPDDIHDLAESMLLMAQDKSLRAQLARNALSFVEDYRWAKRRSEYFSLVARLIRDRPVPGQG